MSFDGEGEGGGIFGDAPAGLGEDVGDILDMARRRIAASAGAASKDRPTGVDLNRPGAAEQEGLEDADLEAHRQRARARLAEDGALPRRVDLAGARALDQRNQQKLSEVRLMVSGVRDELAQAADRLVVEASNAAKLCAGTTPHGYPGKESPTTAANLLIDTFMNAQDGKSLFRSVVQILEDYSTLAHAAALKALSARLEASAASLEESLVPRLGEAGRAVSQLLVDYNDTINALAPPQWAAQ